MAIQCEQKWRGIVCNYHVLTPSGFNAFTHEIFVDKATHDAFRAGDASCAPVETFQRSTPLLAEKMPETVIPSEKAAPVLDQEGKPQLDQGGKEILTEPKATLLDTVKTVCYEWAKKALFVDDKGEYIGIDV